MESLMGEPFEGQPAGGTTFDFGVCTGGASSSDLPEIGACHPLADSPLDSGGSHPSSTNPHPSGQPAEGYSMLLSHPPDLAPAEHIHRTYPPAYATHEQVVADPDLFQRTLQRFHEDMGASLPKVPCVGGKELDLHLLYCQVAGLGGCQQVVALKRWREVAAPFGLPPTITSVSYTLRKAYTTFLFDYEQVYYFRQTGQAASIPPQVEAKPQATDRVRKPRKRKEPTVALYSPPHPDPNLALQLSATAAAAAMPDPMAVGTQGGVTIDAQFDAGYFVTVNVAGHQFQGTLHFPEHTTSDLAGLGTSFGSKSSQTYAREQRKTGEESGLACHEDAAEALGGPAGNNGLYHAQVQQQPQANLHDSAHGSPVPPNPADSGLVPPVAAKSAYTFFCFGAGFQARLAFPSCTEADLNNMTLHFWQQLSDAQKALYDNLAEQDLQRYRLEMEAYGYELAKRAASKQAEAISNQIFATLAPWTHAAAAQFSAAGNALCAPPDEPILGDSAVPVSSE